MVLEMYLTMAEVLLGGNELRLLLDFSTALVVSVQQAVEALEMSLNTTNFGCTSGSVWCTRKARREYGASVGAVPGISMMRTAK